MFRGRFTFTNEEPAPTQYQQQQQWQGGGQMQPYVNQQSNLPSVFGQSQPVRHQAGDERWVRTATFTETSTNDTSISLQKAANAQVAGNSTTLNLIVGTACAALMCKVAAPLIETAIKGFCVLVLVAFAVGFFAFYKGFEPKGR